MRNILIISLLFILFSCKKKKKEKIKEEVKEESKRRDKRRGKRRDYNIRFSTYFNFC